MKKILLGQAHNTKIKTKEGKNYLITGMSGEDKLLCRDLDMPGSYAVIHPNDIEDAHIESPNILSHVGQPHQSRYGDVV